jgi:hypothetical protein
MTVITKARALDVIRRAYGEQHAQTLVKHLPDRIDLDNPKDAALLAELGLTPDRLFNELGAEL